MATATAALELREARASSSFNEHHGAQRALQLDQAPFASHPTDRAPWWAATVRPAGATPFPHGAVVTDVEVCGDLRGADHGRDQCFESLRVELIDADGRAVWQSPYFSADPEDGAGGARTERAVIAVPGARFACGVRVARRPRPRAAAGAQNALAISLVRCFGRPARRLLALVAVGETIILLHPPLYSY